MNGSARVLVAAAALVVASASAADGFIVSGYPVADPVREAESDPAEFASGFAAASGETAAPVTVNRFSWFAAPIETRFSSFPPPFVIIIR